MLSVLWLAAELTNLANHPEMKQILSFMAKELIRYAKEYRDPNLKIIDLRNSLEEAINN